MSNRLGRKVSSSPFFTRHIGAQPLEQLEQRAMMSAALPEGATVLDWGNGQVVAKQGSYVLTFDDAYGSQQAELLAREAATRLGLTATNIQSIGRGRYASFETAGRITLAQADALERSMPHLTSLDPNALYNPTRVPNDPRYADQYWLDNTGQFIGQLGTIGADINATEAWDLSIGSRSVIVAVIDTGIDIDHPDLIPNLWTNPGEIPGNNIDDDGNGFVDDVHGYDFGEGDGNPDDRAGHGTAVAGTIGAAGNNGQGVTGVNWNVSLMGLKIADRFGNLTLAAIIGAHDYATMMINRGFNIVASNNSYGAFRSEFYADAPTGFSGERDAIQRFIDTGATFVAAAGNDTFDNDDPNASHFPSSYNIPGVISVAASDNNDALADFSNFGQRTVTLAAPGVLVLTTTINGGYGFVDGTSFSSPIVAGAVALMQAYYASTHNGQNASAIAIREALINGSDLKPGFEGKVQSGGRINIRRSMELLTIDGPVIRGVNPGPVTGQLNPATGQPINTIAITFSKDIDPASLSNASAALIGDGVDNIFGTGDDRVIPITSIVRSTTNPRLVTITLSLSGFAQSRLPIDSYRLTLAGTGSTGIRDTSGNYLNGNTVSGSNQIYNFRVTASTGDTEPNDTLALATVIPFDSAGQANFSGVTIGNGFAGNLDVDLYRIDLARGGLITAEITAKRLPAPSSLDSYLRLFDAFGVEIASNDQAFGADSFIDFYVFTGGTYYIGVSGFGNDSYNPAVSASGTSQSTGVYNLRIQVTPGTDDTVSYASTDANLPRRVPPQQGQTQGTASSFIDIADTRQILDINIKLDITHSFDQDLKISLIGPDNTTVVLVNSRGGNGQNFTNTIFDDEGTISITSGFAPFTGVFRPEQILGAFDGGTATGRWTLVVQDQRNLNSGFLNSWSLTITYRNNVFGPFESNDTIASAKPLTEIQGTGTATRDAFIGDGGFGSLDRDIYRFTANAGSSLNVAVTSNGSLNAALRLFDVTGSQILFSAPGGTNSVLLENFIFANSGTYYLAISENANVAYDPTVAASGVPASSTGNYTLNVFLAAGVSDPATVLTGSPLSVGVNVGGTFGVGGGTALLFNGIEFLPLTGRNSFLGLVSSGNSFTNSTVGTDLPFALTTASDSFNNRITARSGFRGLNVDRNISYATSDSFAAIDIYFTNTTGSILSSIAWMEGFNPDPGVTLNENDAATANDVDDSNHLVTATYTNNEFGNGLTIGLAAPESDGRARATVLGGGAIVRDPSIILAQPVNDPNGTASNSSIVLTFDIGDLAPGATTSIRYFIFVGTSPAAVQGLADAVNNGTGTGHLAADPANPAPIALDTGTAPAASIPSLPYSVYYPEGFFGDNIYTFVPISNLSDQTASVYVIAHYETGNRDQIIGQLSIGANARSGLTITTPELFESGSTLAGRLNAPFALEVRSDRPVAATFSHYDLGILSGHQAAIGESFTSVTSTVWSFGQTIKGLGGNVDFVVFYNPSDTLTKVSGEFYPATGGAPFETAFNLEAGRRGGFAVNDLTTVAIYAFSQDFVLQADYRVNFSRASLGFTTINGAQISEGTVLAAGTVIRSGSVLGAANTVPEGTYGVRIVSDDPIVASLSHYNFSELNAAGAIGSADAGSLTGVIPEGQFGTNSTNETVSALNTNSTTATVVFSFLFQNGSAYRTSLIVPTNSQGSINVADLANFPTNQPYGVFYESDVPVTVSTLSRAFGDAETSTVATEAFSLWGFGEGFRPGDNDVPAHPGVVEQLRLYNPSDTDITIEITIGYDGIPGSETFRRTLPARRVTEFNMDQFITGGRRLTDQFFGTRVKSPVPIVAYMDHYDRAFRGLVPDPTPGAAFGTLGTPLGRRTAVT